jgi:hypothetical protein
MKKIKIADADLYGINHPESLSHETPEEAIEEYIEEYLEPGDVTNQIMELGSIEVTAYTHAPINVGMMAYAVAELLAETAASEWDDEFGGIEDDEKLLKKDVEEFKQSAYVALKKLYESRKPFVVMEVSGSALSTVTVPASEILELMIERKPEWFEEK